MTVRLSSPSPAVPVLLRLAAYRRRGRILNLQPVLDPAGSIRRAEPLAHDPLTAERASVLEDHRALAAVVLAEGDALVGPAEELCQKALSLLDRGAPQVVAVQLDQVEGAKYRGMVVPMVAQQLERRFSSAAICRAEGR
jgi:hypothetical protein